MCASLHSGARRETHLPDPVVTTSAAWTLALDWLLCRCWVQKKQSVTVTFEHSPDNAHAVNTLARELGVSWRERFPVGGTFVLKGRLNKDEISAFRTRFGQEPWFTLQV
jgi:hypothetical protein